MNLRKNDEEDELPIYEIRGNECIAVLGDRVVVKRINFKKIKSFLSDE